MATILKCKICGGDLENVSKDIAICQYCGTKQILPKMTSERKANLHDRANHYRSINEFDKAFAVYEQVLAEDDTDAEVYWDLVLCRYGVEYVEDPRTNKRIPTVNRTQFQSIYEDSNYIAAVEHASTEQKDVIEADAEQIDRIQKSILEISSKEQPYDIFICYKETDNGGRRTPDSVLAQDIYKALTEEGYKVFFSRITLEDKLGSAYEPYIFAALNSAKVMIVVGTRAEYLNAVWVKNEWSRYLGLINAGEKKVLIPAYKEMDPYDLPEEFSHLQAQDMGKLGSMQDIVRGVTKIITPVHQTTTSTNVIDVEAYKTRIEVFLENGDFANAEEYCNKVLDTCPKDTETYIYKLCAEMHVKHRNDLGSLEVSFDKNPSFQNAIKFAKPSEKKELEDYLARAKEKELSKRKKAQKVIKYMAAASAVIVVLASVVIFITNGQKRSNALSQAEELAEVGEFTEAYTELQQIGEIGNNSQLAEYVEAGVAFQNKEYESAAQILGSLSGYKNADSMLLQCRYYILLNDIEQVDLKSAKKELAELESAGIEDTENISQKIDYLTLESDFNKKYEAHNYDGCDYLLTSSNIDEAVISDFVQDNREKWYQEAINLIKTCEDFRSYYINLDNAYNIMKWCDGYEDADKYLTVFEERKRASYNKAFDYLSELEVVSNILWGTSGYWLRGTTWKTSDGGYYFSEDEDGNTSYNLPWFDDSNTYYHIDIDGVYFIYDVNDTTIPPTTRKNMYKFELVNRSQMKVTCYKDNSTYMLYKQ